MRLLITILALVLAAVVLAQGPAVDRVGVQDLRYGGSWTRTYATGSTATVYGNSPINILGFGAIPDSTTDNNLYIQAAIDSLEAWGGGTLYVPSGTFSYSESIVLPSGVSIVGEKRTRDGSSAYLSSLVYTGDDYAIRLEETAGGKFRQCPEMANFRLVYAGSDTSVDGISVYRSTADIRNVDVIGFTGNGVDMDQTIYSTLTNVRPEYNDGHGIYIYGSDVTFPNGQMVLVNCTSQQNGRNALRLNNVLSVEIVGGTYALCDSQQVYITGGINVNFSSAHIEPRLGADRTYVTNLFEVGADTVGATNVKSKNISIENSTLYAGQSGAQPRFETGLLVNDGTDGIRVWNNFFTSFTDNAIKFEYTEANPCDSYWVGPNYYFSCPTDSLVNVSQAQGHGVYYDENQDTWVYNGEGISFSLEATAPDSAVGRLWFDSADSTLKLWDGDSWDALH